MDLHHTALAAAVAAVAALTVWRPHVVLGLILVALPFVAQHPSAAPSVWLYVLVLAFELAYALRTRHVAAGLAREPLLVLGVAFAAAAVASLAALPIGDLWAEYLTAVRTTPLGAALWRLEVGLRAFEFEREFSVTSTALTVEAVGLMLVVAHEARQGAARAQGLVLALAAGAWAAAAVGLVEWAGVLDLTRLRGTFAVYARPGSVQSTAGNPGWFTQVLVFCLPYVIVVRQRVSSAALRWIASLVYVGVFVLALALGLQRGGWLAGGVVLVFVAWAAGQVRRPAAPPGRLRLLGAAAAGVLPLVIVVGLAAQLPTDPNGVDVGRRVRALVSSDRWPYWQAAAMVWTRHPVLGGGHESFAYRYRRYFTTSGGVFESSAVRVPDAAAAHSLYMQTLAGTGLGGVALLLALFTTAGVTVRRVMAACDDPDRRALALAAAGSVVGVVVYGLAQEIFYVPALRFLCFASLGLLAAAGTGLVAWSRQATQRVAVAVAVTAGLHVFYEVAWASPDRLVGTGVYGVLPLRPGEAPGDVQWTAEAAAWPVPAAASTVTLEVRSLAPFPQHLRIAGCDSGTALDVTDNVWHAVQLPLVGCGPGSHVWLHVRPAWRPPGDGRLLGVLVQGVRLY